MALKVCYSFCEDYEITKANLSRAIGKSNPSIDRLDIANQSGHYQLKVGKESFIFMQSEKTQERVGPPDYFPPTSKMKAEWDQIQADDNLKLKQYLERIERKRKRELDMDRSKKRKSATILWILELNLKQL